MVLCRDGTAKSRIMLVANEWQHGEQDAESRAEADDKSLQQPGCSRRSSANERPTVNSSASWVQAAREDKKCADVQSDRGSVPNDFVQPRLRTGLFSLAFTIPNDASLERF